MSIWLDDLSREPARGQRPARVRRRQARRRHHLQPDDLRQRPVQR
nr:hypothetical protein [Angustibacter aerolatus]